MVRSTLQRECDAEGIFARALKANPDDARALCELGLLRSEQGLKQEALALFNRAISVSPQMIRAHCSRAWIHDFLPNDPAIETLSTLLQKPKLTSSARLSLLTALGKAHDHVGDYALAFDFYRRMNEEARRTRPFDRSGYRKFMRLIKGASSRAVLPHNPPSQTTSNGLQPIFVVGMTRTGKTLVEKLLTGHEAVAGVGEYRGMQTAIETMRTRHRLRQPFPICLPQLGAQHFSEIGSAYLRGLTSAADGAVHMVNSHPGNFILVGLIARALPNAKIIYCTRGAPDTCLFAYFKNYAKGNEYACDLATLGSYYQEQRQLGDYWLEAHGDRMMTVSYESLVQHPDEITADIFRYCGLQQPESNRTAGLISREVGHASHYEAFLEPLRQALGVNQILKES